MTTKTIDYSAFPHIVNRIICYAPWSALIKTRQTCKALKARVEALLSEKITLQQNYEGSLWVRSPDGCIPGLRAISLNSKTFNDQLDHVLAYTKHTTMVELEGLVDAELDLRIAAPAFPNLETYRVVTDRNLRSFTPYFPFPCKTLVLFYREHGPPGIIHEVLDDFGLDFDDYEEPQLFPPGVTSSVPDGVTKIVVNMSGTDIPVADFFNVFKFPETVKDFVIVFPKYKVNQRKGVFSTFYTSIVVMDTCELIGTDARYVLVGLDEFSSRFDIRKAIRNHFLHKVMFSGPRSPEDIVAELLDHVAVLNKEEYAKEVADIDIEVVERLDGDLEWDDL